MTEDELITASREKATAQRYAVLKAKAAYRALGIPEHHCKVITPHTDPQRFTEQEKKIFDDGKCCWQTETGTIASWEPGGGYCGAPSNPGATFGLCEEHELELLEDFYPDGSRR